MSRTVIDIEDDVLKKAQRLTGMSKKVDVENYALKLRHLNRAAQ